VSLQLEIGDFKNSGSEKDFLLIEIGETYYMISIFNNQKKEFTALQFVTVESFELINKIDEVIKDLQTNDFEKIVICSAFPNALLVPRKLHSDNNSKIFDKGQYQLEAVIPEWQMVALFSLPKQLYQKLDAAFPNATITHCYAPALKVYNGFVSQNQLLVHFVPNQFRVIVKKDQHLQLAQTYSYTAPLDVVYYLLKICNEFNFSQTETYIIISGLIEENSALYKDLNAYFSNVHFAAKPSVTMVENKYPQHFFTSMYNLASCVS
jgi:hypothetical protein